MSIMFRRVALALVALLFSAGTVTALGTGAASAYSPGCQTEDQALSSAQSAYARDYAPAQKLYKKLHKAKMVAKKHHTKAAKHKVKKLKRAFAKDVKKLTKEVKAFNTAKADSTACHNAAGTAAPTGTGTTGTTGTTGSSPTDALTSLLQSLLGGLLGGLGGGSLPSLPGLG